MLGREIAERMRTDIEDFSIDDGRGAVLQVCISIGLVTWEPQQYPAVDMPQLARQMETVARQGAGDCQVQGRQLRGAVAPQYPDSLRRCSE